MPCILSLLLAVVVFRLSLFLRILKVLRNTGQVLCRIFLSWDSSEVFLMVILGLWIFLRKTTEVKHHSYHIISKVYTINVTSLVDVNLYHLANVLFVRFLHQKRIISPSFHTAVFRKNSFCALHTYQAENYAPPPYTATFVICNSSA